MADFPSSVQREREQDGRMARRHEPKTHGRSETRTIRTSTWSIDRILAMGWPEAQRILEIKRIRRVKGKSTREVICGLTSLPREEASPERLLASCRGPWSIENKLFCVRDVTLGGGSLSGLQGGVAAEAGQPTQSGGAYFDTTSAEKGVSFREPRRSGTINSTPERPSRNSTHSDSLRCPGDAGFWLASSRWTGDNSW